MIRIGQFLRNYRVAISAWLLIIAFIFAGLYYRIDNSVVALSILVIGVLGQAFGALIAWVGLVPLVGPMIAHILSLPFIGLLNGVAISSLPSRSGAAIRRMSSIIESSRSGCCSVLLLAMS